jgi:RimJ/RimL family protein N-acetyltransferase
MSVTRSELELRAATLDDATLVADLETLRDPSEPRDPVLLRHWWAMGDELERWMRQIAVRDGVARAYIGASHDRWNADPKRFGVIRPVLRYDDWSDDIFARLVGIGEDWLRSECATTVVTRLRNDFQREIGLLERLGYREDRRMRVSELDLLARRDHIFSRREEFRRRMQEQGVQMRPISDDPDPERFRKLHAMMNESVRDTPTTVPMRELSFDDWHRFWFGNPAIRADRFWVASEGEAIVGTSVLDCPVVRGIPWTAYTGTSRSVRRRGIARALKYESMAQAIESGFTRVRTANDADNPPILRINEEMGYRLVAPVLELHRDLEPASVT